MFFDIFRKKKKGGKIGLVLGSGGARGLAHIGVIKVLEENNIAIDYIAGSSTGAFVGVWYAAFKDIKEVEASALSKNWRDFADILWDPSNAGGFVDGKKVEASIKSHIRAETFEDLKIPCAVVVTNFENGEAEIFRRGVLAPAIRASMSVPLVFKPYEFGGQTYLDGGLSRPVPVEEAKAMGADVIIAVNLDAKYLLGAIKKGKNIFSVSQQSFNIMRYNLAKTEAALADISVEPDTGVYGIVGWTEFFNGQKIVAAGEAAMRAQLPKLKKLLGI